MKNVMEILNKLSDSFCKLIMILLFIQKYLCINKFIKLNTKYGNTIIFVS